MLRPRLKRDLAALAFAGLATLVLYLTGALATISALLAGAVFFAPTLGLMAIAAGLMSPARAGRVPQLPASDSGDVLADIDLRPKNGDGT